MSAGYLPPLAISFIWHPSDSEKIIPVLDEISTSFARDKDRPFSRSLNVPLFFFSSPNSREAPVDYPEQLAESNIVFVFTSVNTIGRKEWRRYVEGLPQSPSVHTIPVAIDSDGYNHNGALSGLNCIRTSDWPIENNELYAVVSLAHEVYRFGCQSIPADDKGKESSITIFLSHSKSGDTGKGHSECVKEFIDNTNMNRFFDANEISPGYHFDQEIEKHIQDSTLLAIESDAYSSRYWCQRELLLAKKNNRPVLIVDCLEDFEDRVFPAASNVPCVHVAPAVPLRERDVLRILSGAIIETIRHCHSMKCLEAYRRAGWIDADCELTSRPPEIRQVLSLKKKGKEKVCYPEPPVYAIESDWHQDLEVQAFTPLWSPSDSDCLSAERVGISISDASYESYSEHHVQADHLVRLAQDLGRHLLARSAILLYGGDLRPGGFTEFILDEANILKDRLGETNPHVENHLAWPIYVSEPDITAWRARFHKVMETVEHEIPGDVVADVDQDAFLPPNTTRNSYIWSRCLTEMREKSISSSTARICAGGRLSGYMGKMPGVLEEIVLALDAQQPVYLLGAFGGVVGAVCDLVLSAKVTEELTESWQISHNDGYSELQELARSNGHHCDYDGIIGLLQQISLPDLSSRCGLDENEYKRLMKSPFVDECVYLILKGLKTKGH